MGDPAGLADGGTAAHPGSTSRRRDRNQWVAAGLVATLVLGVGAWALVSTVGSLLFCGPEDTAYARRLTESGWLRLQPSSARALAEPEAACEADDRMATATRTISVPDMTLVELRAFYGRTLADRGWQRGDGSTGGCWWFNQAPQSISLTVEPLERSHDFAVSLSSSLEGHGGWCSP
ncbi:MAG: hypothetical protein IE926_02850 [Micrococcales bacterium]|nr:hypothetical protein [Micrococcales bacterium]